MVGRGGRRDPAPSSRRPGVAGADVAAVGLTGQMHGARPARRARRGPAAGDPVERPADRRRRATRSARRSAPERLIAITGNDALTGFTAPKLVWVRDHEPEVWARDRPRAAAQGLRPAAADRRARAGQGRRRRHAAVRPRGPRLVAGGARGAAASTRRGCRRRSRAPRSPGVVIAAAAADATGLRAGTPVVAGGGDQAANAVGVGAVAPGRRGAVARHVRRRLRHDRRRRCASPRGQVHAFCHAVPGPLAPDDGDAVGGRQPALVPRRAGAGRGVRRRSSAAAGEVAGRRATACCSCPTSPASAARTRTRWPAARSSA